MKDRTFNLAIACFPYGGNGGMANEYPGVRNFIVETQRKASKDPRIDQIHHCDFSDTPITMTRNQSVIWARQMGADFLLMLDSDMQPDCEMRDDPQAKPFWDTSFDFCVQNYDHGPNVVCAPYCGPPPVSNVYAFYWALDENDCPNDRGRIVQYTREEASRMVGIQPVAAQPTGVILFDMRAFDLTDPLNFYNHLLSQGKTREEAKALCHPWFYYEWEDIYHAHKASTEDVTATRDISFHGWVQHGRETIYCNWDAWAGHVKPKIVRKPRPLDSRVMHAAYRYVVEQKQTSEEKLVYLGNPAHVVEPGHPDYGVRTGRGNGHDDSPLFGMNGSPADYEVLSSLIRDLQPAMAVEVGSWVGESANVICEALPEFGKLICVDHFRGSPADGSGTMAVWHTPAKIKAAFLKNTAKWEGKIWLWEMTSSQAIQAAYFHDCRPIDFLYLDADHEYEAVKAQILEWLPLMSPDGVIAGHDFSDDFPGVKRAVGEMFTKWTHIPGTAVWSAHMQDLRELSSVPKNGQPYEPETIAR